MTISEYIAKAKAICNTDDMSEEDFERYLDGMRGMFGKVGNPPIINRLQLIKDKIESPTTNDKVRWEYIEFLLQQYTPSWDIWEWLLELEKITEGFVNDARE
tara:strand:- start:180 stop:485 length:306 start_codon:yes stop_codon:yes gene_type:complete